MECTGGTRAYTQVEVMDAFKGTGAPKGTGSFRGIDTIRRGIAGPFRLLGLLLVFLSATPSELAAQRLATRIYSELDGLSSSDVKDVIQTRDGRLWFATRTGLSSYDGMSWSAPGPREGLPFASLQGLELDSQNRLWVLSAKDTAVSVAEQGRWKTVIPPADHPPPGFMPVDFAVADVTDADATDADATVNDSQAPRILILLSTGEVRIWSRSWQPIDTLSEVSPMLAVGSEGGRFWLAGEKLWRLGASRVPVPMVLPPEAVGAIHAHARIGERRWLVGSRWAGWIEPAVDSRAVDPRKVTEFGGFWQLPETLTAKPGDTKLTSDGQGGVIITSSSGIFQVGHESVRRLGSAQGLGFQTATGAVLDREGQIWITSKQGVTKIRSLLTTAWDQRAGLFDDEVSAVAELPDGTMVFGHEGGLSFLQSGGSAGEQPSTESFTTGHRKPFRVMDIAVLDQETLWIAASTGALARRDEHRRPRWTWVADPSPEMQIAALALDPQNGSLWAAGGPGAGPVIEDEVRWDPSAPRSVRRIAFDPNANLYVVTHLNGVWIKDPDHRWIRMDEPAGLDRNLSLFTVLVADDSVWVGGSEGLYRVRDHRLEKVVSPPIQRPVFALLRDRRQALWVGTDDGAYRVFDGKARHFGLAHGLQGRETNRAALVEDRHGAIWIGTQLGVTRIAPDDQQTLPPPRVEISRLEVGARSLPADRPITLEHDHHGVSYSLRRLTLIDAERVEWAARLIGLEKDFQPLDVSATEVRYINLPPGDYELEVRARWKGQDWGPIARSATLHVDRPWWLDPRFQTLALLGVGALIWLPASAFAAKRHSRLLGRQVAARTRELQELTHQLRSEIEEHQRTEKELRVANVAAEQASRAKSSFLATMSHEIRTPMSGVLGIARLLARDSTLNPQQRERVETLHQSGKALLEILDDVLDYSKIEAGRLDIQPVRFDLHSLLDEVVALFSAHAQEKSLDLILDRRPELPQWVRGDGARIRQVLLNLIGNAVKFTERGSVRLAANRLVAKGHPSVRNVVIEITDTGIGIEESLLQQLFQPFHQLESSHHRRHGGTGLGLAISRRLVSAMDGNLRVQSRPGEGTTFSLELPLPAVEAPTLRETDPDVELPSESGRPLAILVAEDNPINQMIVVDMLAELGHEDVTIAENGLEVLQAVGDKCFDLILMDLQMPELDGLETAQRLIEKLGADTPHLVALTAHAIEGTEALCREAGMHDYLTKPVSFEALFGALRNCP